MTRTLPLVNAKSGLLQAVTYVDDEDFAGLAERTWRLHVDGYACYYTKRCGISKVHFLHRVLLDAPVGTLVDHIDRRRLNNRRSNLRLCTNAESVQNRRSFTGSSSTHRGVEKRVSPRTGRVSWRATAKINGRRYGLGHYANESDAAAAASRFRAQNMPFSEDALRKAPRAFVVREVDIAGRPVVDQTADTATEKDGGQG